MYEILTIKSKNEFELIDITDKVREFVKRNVKNGIVIVFTKHTTTALIINENEHGLLQDIKETLFKLIPKRGNYKHDYIDNNAHSHLKSIILNTCLVIPIINNEMVLGTWQRIFLVELDGPRERKIIVKGIEEK